MQKTQNQQAKYATKALLALLACIYLSTPFSDIALISFPEKELRVSVYHCLAIFFFIAICGSAFFSSERPGLFPFSYEMAFLLFWLVSVAFSLLMPVAINGQLSYTEIGALSVGESRPILLSPWHFVHFAYLLGGITISFGTVLILRSTKEIRTLLIIALAGITLSACIGLAQFLFATNSLASFPTILGKPVIQNDVLRLKGFAKEPSLFVVPLLSGLSAITVAFWFSKTLRTKILWLMLIAFFAGVCYLSRSTTGIGGIFSSVFIGSTLSLFTRKNWQTSVTIACVVLVAMTSVFFAFLMEPIYEKLNHGSFELRMTSVVLALNLGLESPILGVGFGVVPSFDLFSKIFVGTGLVGFLFFAGFLVFGFCRSLYALKLKAVDESDLQLTAITLAAFWQIVVTYTVSGFSYQNGDFWIVSGLLIASRMTINQPQNFTGTI